MVFSKNNCFSFLYQNSLDNDRASLRNSYNSRPNDGPPPPYVPHPPGPPMSNSPMMRPPMRQSPYVPPMGPPPMGSPMRPPMRPPYGPPRGPPMGSPMGPLRPPIAAVECSGPGPPPMGTLVTGASTGKYYRPDHEIT